MNHSTTPDFWEHYNALPQEVRELADKNYDLLRMPGLFVWAVSTAL